MNNLTINEHWAHERKRWFWVKFNIMRVQYNENNSVNSCIICNNILWIRTMVGSLPLFSEGEPAAMCAHWRAIQCKKSSLNSDECFPRRILNSVDFYTFQRTHLKPLSPNSLHSYAWQAVSVRSVGSSSEPHCCFSLSHSMTPCWFFFLPYYSLRKGIFPHLLW